MGMVMLLKGSMFAIEDAGICQTKVKGYTAPCQDFEASSCKASQQTYNSSARIMTLTVFVMLGVSAATSIRTRSHRARAMMHFTTFKHRYTSGLRDVRQ